MDTHSLQDPVEPLYDARIRGVGIISTVMGERVHIHGGCWWAPCSGLPPSLMVAFPKEFEGAQVVQAGGVFTVNVLAQEESTWNAAFFAGHHHIGDHPPGTFLVAPSGCPVLADAVAYFDCRVTWTLDLGDFLLVTGMINAAAVINPQRDNLTVNTIIAREDPRGVEDAHLPFQGFDFPTRSLAPAPYEPAINAARFQAMYRFRHWGAFLVSVGHGGEQRMHISTWSIQTSHRPPRMAVAFDATWDEVAWLDQPQTRVLMALMAEGQGPWQGWDLVQGPVAPSEHWMPGPEGTVRPRGALAYFSCRVESHHRVGDNTLALCVVEDADWDAREAANLEALAVRPARDADPR